MAHHLTALKNVPAKTPDAPAPEKTERSFFSLAQAHVGEPVQLAWDATNTLSPSAKESNYGMGPQVRPGKPSRENWSPRTASPSASTGRCQEVARPQATPSNTGAPAAGKQITEPSHALGSRRLNALSPYKCDAWAAELRRHGLQDKYPSLAEGLANSFDLGIPKISRTYTPPNHHSVNSLTDIYNTIIKNEFVAGRYIGPFTHAQVEANIGPFQSSPLSLVPKASKPGKYRAVHNFSHPHIPSPETISINTHINSNAFPCTWGTFSMVALLIARLPPGSQASVHDVAEAYRTIPTAESQWPGLVIRLQADDQFAVNTCNNFNLASARGVYRMVADASANIFHSNGIGPLAKWVNDHIFF
jgi:hypothetical protein